MQTFSRAAPGETVRVRFVIAWYAPTCYNYWDRCTEKTEDGEERDVTWKNYYATVFSGAYDAVSFDAAIKKELIVAGSSTNGC